jgi:hypothetical protein
MRKMDNSNSDNNITSTSYGGVHGGQPTISNNVILISLLFNIDLIAISIVLRDSTE